MRNVHDPTKGATPAHGHKRTHNSIDVFSNGIAIIAGANLPG